MIQTFTHNTPRPAALLQIRHRYLQQKALLYALQALGLLLPLLAIWYRGWGGTTGQATAIIVGVAVLAFYFYRWRQMKDHTDLAAVARHLNRKYPVLEESAQLLLLPEQDLPLLGRLQQQRTAEALKQIPAAEAARSPFTKGWMMLAAGLALSTILFFLPEPGQAQGRSPLLETNASANVNEPVAAPKAILPAIEKLNLRISPPAYTRKARYAVTTPSFKAEVGARAVWTVQTTKPVSSLQLVFSGRKPVQLQPVAGQANTYTASLTVTQSGLYHFRLNGQASDFYSIEVIPDEAPSITIRKPGQYSEILFGDPQRVTIQATMQDDYGLRTANLIATVAKGEGEAVKFREARIPLQLSFNGQPRRLELTQTLDLQKLGMTYGDELYFYLQAYDNHRGYTRSETFLVQIEDTAVVETMDDLSLGVNPNPEYFRSQRQIIIDTEKLIQEQKSLPPATFQERSNNIGVDQKLLRLRYGKFLGEEFESAIGKNALPPGAEQEHHADDGHDHSQDLKKGETEYQSRMNELLDPYLHKHDQEEAATFFEPAIKGKLKGALAQMWEAELRLRTHRPKEALPFEYKALRLLKEVQQSARVYVKKSGYEPPPLKEPEKRLSGELGKIRTVKTQRKEKPEPTAPLIRQALVRVATLRQGQRPTASDADVLNQASLELGKAAVQEPGQYLRALQDIRQLTQDIRAQRSLCSACLSRVEAALHRFLPDSQKTPQKRVQSGASKTLAQDYFNRLN